MTIHHRGKDLAFPENVVENMRDWAGRDLTAPRELDYFIKVTAKLYGATDDQLNDYVFNTPSKEIVATVMKEVNRQLKFYKPIEGAALEDSITEEIIKDEELMKDIAKYDITPTKIREMYPPEWMSVEKFMEIKKLADEKYGKVSE